MSEEIIHKLLASGSDAVRQMLTDAFEAGKAVGRKEAADRMRGYMAQVAYYAANPGEAPPTPLGSIPYEQTATPPAPAPESSLPVGTASFKEVFRRTMIRAPRGSVRPGVLQWLYSGNEGRPAEVSAAIGANENSVRGTLNQFKSEGLADKDGDVWRITKQGKAERQRTMAEGERNTRSEGIEAASVEPEEAPLAASHVTPVEPEGAAQPVEPVRGGGT